VKPETMARLDRWLAAGDRGVMIQVDCQLNEPRDSMRAVCVVMFHPSDDANVIVENVVSAVLDQVGADVTPNESQAAPGTDTESPRPDARDPHDR
jgi:hypothetical protein